MKHTFKANRFESLLARHAVLIQKTGRELATNFDICAYDIIGLACAEMGISVATWNAMKSYQIAKEQGA